MYSVKDDAERRAARSRIASQMRLKLGWRRQRAWRWPRQHCRWPRGAGDQRAEGAEGVVMAQGVGVEAGWHPMAAPLTAPPRVAFVKSPCAMAICHRQIKTAQWREEGKRPGRAK